MGGARVTASLYQAHAPWPTSTYIKVDVEGADGGGSGIGESRSSGTVTLTVEQAADLARGLGHLAGQGAASQERQTSEGIQQLSGQVPG
jgi:predicted DNA-binding transcriptional regulator YafY